MHKGTTQVFSSPMKSSKSFSFDQEKKIRVSSPII